MNGLVVLKKSPQRAKPQLGNAPQTHRATSTKLQPGRATGGSPGTEHQQMWDYQKEPPQGWGPRHRTTKGEIWPRVLGAQPLPHKATGQDCCPSGSGKWESLPSGPGKPTNEPKIWLKLEVLNLRKSNLIAIETLP